jgi:hypothetical protein
LWVAQKHPAVPSSMAIGSIPTEVSLGISTIKSSICSLKPPFIDDDFIKR